MTYLLGIDIGTSSVKALLFDAEHGATVAVHGEEYPIHTPGPGYAEQDPEDYWRASVIAVRKVTSLIRANAIAGISFSGQMHGTLLLDAALRPLAPAIIWADARTANEATQLVEKYPDWAQLAGTNPAAGFQIATLAWLKKHNPALLEQTRRVILPKDYVRLKMTGEAQTDITDAAATGALNVVSGTWAAELLEVAGIAPDILPPILPSYAVTGTLRAEAAAELCLPAGIPIIAGCADQPAQAIGSGLVNVGMGSVTIGTGGQVFIPYQPAGTLQTDARLHVFNHAVPEMWYVLGAILAAGLALRWLRNLCGLQNTPDAYALLSHEAAQVSIGADGLIFLPYLLGERTPHMDALARGSFVGLGYHHQRGHLARAVMEGVGFALRDALSISLSLGAVADSIVVAGGGAESAVWRQILTDILGMPLRKSRQQEQACIGAAILAGVGSQIYPDIATPSQQFVQYDEPTLPNPAQQARYDALYEQFRALYPALRASMHTLAKQPAAP
jgi:xylulokinase